jgi:hypothetical protein
MSHGDKLVALPEGFRSIGTSANAPFSAIANPERRIYGVQFHPEVAHTPRGGEVLRAFLFGVAGLSPSFTPQSFSQHAVESVRQKVGPTDRAICGLSGGVDSSVAAVLCHRALGDRLTCVFVDNGVLRQGEAEQVVHLFRDALRIRLLHIDARERFLGALRGVTDPERKRKIIGGVFIDVFQEEAARIEGVKWLVQGTLYPDVIESVSATGGPSVTIKSHHNVGGLPERMKLRLIEPLRELFKDEVRLIGRELGVPGTVVAVHLRRLSEQQCCHEGDRGRKSRATIPSRPLDKRTEPCRLCHLCVRPDRFGSFCSGVARAALLSGADLCGRRRSDLARAPGGVWRGAVRGLVLGHPVRECCRARPRAGRRLCPSIPSPAWCAATGGGALKAGQARGNGWRR